MDDLRTFRDGAGKDIQRWLDELLQAPARSTLLVGIVMQAYKFAEEILRKIAEVAVEAAGDAGLEAVATVSKGGKKLARLTLGEYVQLLVFMDSRRLLVPDRKIISKADKALLDRVSASRNDFTHRYIDQEKTRELLSDVHRLIALPVVEVGSRLRART